MSNRAIGYTSVGLALLIYVSIFWASQAGIMPVNSWKVAGDIASIYVGMACWLSAARYFKKSKFAVFGSLIILGAILTWNGWSAVL